MYYARQRSSPRLLAWGCMLAMLALAGCNGDRVVTADGDTAEGDASSSDTSSAASTTSTTAPQATGSTTNATAADDTSTDSSAGFVPPPGDVSGSFECDLLTQDCPPGFKCMAWANDGGGAWNDTRCTPIAEDPVPVDGPCHVEGSPTTGIDDCELGAICYDVDPKTLEGTCVPMCVGTESELYCEDPNRYCYLSGDGAILPCIELCDPVAQDCPAGQACYAIQDAWVCAPDASMELGAYGDPCEFINVCDPGLICLGASAVPPGLPCEGAAGCCTEVCDITDPAGDSQCAGVAEGQTCQAWYEEGTAPVVLEHVGVCALPG